MALLLIDTNEVATAPEVYDQLAGYFGAANVVKTQLPVADVAVSLGNNGILRVERKTPQDFAASIADGRLARQVDGMVKSKAWSAVVVTGKLVFNDDDLLLLDGRPSGWHGSAVRAAMRSVVFAGALLEQCPPGHYARTIDELIKFASKPSHAQYHPAAKRHKPLLDFYPDDTLVQERVEFLMGLPGVGAKMARALLDWCGSRDHSATGTLAEALSWITLFPEMEAEGLPPPWSPKKAVAPRDFLMGGSEQGILKVESEVDL